MNLKNWWINLTKQSEAPKKIIIEGKIFDLTTSKVICCFSTYYSIHHNKYTKIFKSKNNNYFQITQENIPSFPSAWCKEEKSIIDKKQAITICSQYLPAEKIMELFGELEEG